MRKFLFLVFVFAIPLFSYSQKKEKCLYVYKKEQTIYKFLFGRGDEIIYLSVNDNIKYGYKEDIKDKKTQFAYSGRIYNRGIITDFTDSTVIINNKPILVSEISEIGYLRPHKKVTGISLASIGGVFLLYGLFRYHPESQFSSFYLLPIFGGTIISGTGAVIILTSKPKFFDIGSEYYLKMGTW